EHIRKEFVQRRRMLDAKIVERVVIDRHAAAQPAIRVMMLATPLQLATAADAFLGGIQPQRQQQPWVRRRSPRLIATLGQGGVIHAQIESPSPSPDRPGFMIRRQKLLEINRLHDQLLAIRPPTTQVIHDHASFTNKSATESSKERKNPKLCADRSVP